MSSVRVLAGDTERIQTPALKDGSLVAVTGSTTVVLSIQRQSDNFWYDFADDTFKSSGWTTRQQQMTEVSASLAPGEYRYDWDTSSITNVAADDTYLLRVDETGGTVRNVPVTGEMKMDQWVADIRDAVQAVDTRLPSDPADESLQQASHAQTQADIAALNDISAADVDTTLTASHGAGSWQTATETNETEVRFSVAYDDAVSAEVLRVACWLVRAGTISSSPTAMSLTWYTQSGTSLFTRSDASGDVSGPDAQGVYLLETVAGVVTLSDDQAYYVEIAITDATGTVTTFRGTPTAG